MSSIEILSSIWFFGTNQAIGLVEADLKDGEGAQAFIGVGKGYDASVDAQHIALHGAKFSLEAFRFCQKINQDIFSTANFKTFPAIIKPNLRISVIIEQETPEGWQPKLGRPLGLVVNDSDDSIEAMLNTVAYMLDSKLDEIKTETERISDQKGH